MTVGPARDVTAMIRHSASARRLLDGDVKHWHALVAQSLRHQPSVCVYTSDDVTPSTAVSWSMIQLDGSIGMGYTLPQYRGLGLAPIVVNLSAAAVLQSGAPFFGYVSRTNELPRRLLDEHYRCLDGAMQFVHYDCGHVATSRL